MSAKNRQGKRAGITPLAKGRGLPPAEIRARYESPTFYTTPATIRQILTTACGGRRPVTLTCVEGPIAKQARFVEWDAGGIRVELVPSSHLHLEIGEKSSPFRPLMLVTAHFNHDFRACLFHASLLKIETPKGSPLQVVLGFPAWIAGSESRLMYRVPFKPTHGISIKVKTKDGRVWVPEIINISLGGVLTRFTPKHDPDLSRDQTAQVIMTMDGESVEIDAVVVRKQGRSYGWFFPEVLGETDLEAPDVLRNIVSYYEKRWLSKRIR